MRDSKRQAHSSSRRKRERTAEGQADRVAVAAGGAKADYISDKKESCAQRKVKAEMAWRKCRFPACHGLCVARQNFAGANAKSQDCQDCQAADGI